jgi:hypothetical protein
MSELELLRQEAIYLFNKNQMKEGRSYARSIERLENDTDKVRLKRVISFFKRGHKMNPREKAAESLKICRDVDKKFGTNLYELELKTQKALRDI